MWEQHSQNRNKSAIGDRNFLTSMLVPLPKNVLTVTSYVC
jgi:hypothetical protein